MLNKAERLRVLTEVQQVLGLSDDRLAQLPQIVRELAQTAVMEPCLVAFVFQPNTGQLRQVAMSRVPQTPDAYATLSRVTAGLAQQFQNLALEVAKNVAGKQESVGETGGPCGDAERRDGQPGENANPPGE